MYLVRRVRSRLRILSRCYSAFGPASVLTLRYPSHASLSASRFRNSSPYLGVGFGVCAFCLLLPPIDMLLVLLLGLGFRLLHSWLLVWTGFCTCSLRSLLVSLYAVGSAVLVFSLLLLVLSVW